jgi:hypothetical protein
MRPGAFQLDADLHVRCPVLTYENYWDNDVFIDPTFYCYSLCECDTNFYQSRQPGVCLECLEHALCECVFLLHLSFAVGSARLRLIGFCVCLDTGKDSCAMGPVIGRALHLRTRS